MSRLRLFGVVDAVGRERACLRYLRAMPEPELVAALSACCGSRAWVARMCEERAARPASFASLAALTRCAGELWIALAPEDWDQAFRAHPRIGESKARDRQGAAAEGWSKKEQASVDAASQAARDELRATNAAYEAKFGRIYIVCATGKTVDEMVALARERMTNDPATELRRAADEQRRITELRLEKLVLR